MAHQPKIRYGVAASLDGFIAGPNGEFDWIPENGEIDFVPIWAQFDLFLMGRRTWEIARLGPDTFAGKQVFVASRTLRPEKNPGITLLPDITREVLADLRGKATRDIWLFGGSQLAGAVHALHEIDELDLSVFPILLGAGIPLLPTLPRRTALKLLDHRTYPSGTLQLRYALKHGGPENPVP